MSKSEYNQLYEFNEEVKSNYPNNYPQINNFSNSQKKISNTDVNFNNNKNYMMSSGFNINNAQTKVNNQKIPIKWRNVMKIDIDAIKNTNDLSLLSSYLENFLYSTITEDDIQAVPEGNVVKLIKILQFSNEYLLNSRQNLNENINNLEGQKQLLINELQKIDEKIINQKQYLDKAKKERKIRMKEISDYKNAVISLVKGGVPISGFGGTTKITDINVDINRKYNYSQSKLRGPINGYKCKYCIGKIFSSEFELKKHLNDIHLIDQFPDEEYGFNRNIKPQTNQEINLIMPPLNNNNLNKNDELEKKLNNMKNEYQEIVHKFEMDLLKNQINQKNVNNEGDYYKLQHFNYKKWELLLMIH